MRREKKENERERERERDREKNGTKERNKYTLSHIPQIPWPVTCTLHSKQSLSALLLNMSIKVREGGKFLKLARRWGGVSSFGIYSNSTVLAFLIYYIQSVLNVIKKICVLCIAVLLTRNSWCRLIVFDYNSVFLLWHELYYKDNNETKTTRISIPTFHTLN